MKGLFQCPPWAKSFVPFQGVLLFQSFVPFLGVWAFLRKLIKDNYS